MLGEHSQSHPSPRLLTARRGGRANPANGSLITQPWIKPKPPSLEKKTPMLFFFISPSPAGLTPCLLPAVGGTGLSLGSKTSAGWMQMEEEFKRKGLGREGRKRGGGERKKEGRKKEGRSN